MNDIKEILTINAGSSSIKFAVYENTGSNIDSLSGKVVRIGLDNTKLISKKSGSGEAQSVSVDASDFKATTQLLMEWLENQMDFKNLKGVGHRVVNGMKHTQPEIISKVLLDELQ